MGERPVPATITAAQAMANACQRWIARQPA
jgi:hypothetical protein